MMTWSWGRDCTANTKTVVHFTLAFFPTCPPCLSTVTDFLLMSVSLNWPPLFILVGQVNKPGPEQGYCSCNAWLSKQITLGITYMGFVSTHNCSTPRGFSYLISFGNWMAKVAGSLTARYISNNLLFFSCSAWKRVVTPLLLCTAWLVDEVYSTSTNLWIIWQTFLVYPTKLITGWA